ncbi:MAG: hypothetical protein ACKV2Q_01740 [Planctomycetaceae bacterium]
MSQIETQESVLDEIEILLKDQRMASGLAGVRREQRDGWQTILEKWLWNWDRDPSQLEDEGISAPSAETIHRACEMALSLRDTGLLAPQRVAATGDGGIVLAWEKGLALSTLEVDADGTIEVVNFENAQVVSQHRFG